MSAASENRYRKFAAEQARAAIDATVHAADAAKAMQIAADCDQFARAAWSFIVEPTALRRSTVERAKNRRGWSRRHAALVAAHCAWVGADHRTMAGVAASIARAQAAYALLVFCLGGWTIPAGICVPRVATCTATRS